MLLLYFVVSLPFLATNSLCVATVVVLKDVVLSANDTRWHSSNKKQLHLQRALNCLWSIELNTAYNWDEKYEEHRQSRRFFRFQSTFAWHIVIFGNRQWEQIPWLANDKSRSLDITWRVSTLRIHINPSFFFVKRTQFKCSIDLRGFWNGSFGVNIVVHTSDTLWTIYTFYDLFTTYYLTDITNR